jgi:hypothetical protein
MDDRNVEMFQGMMCRVDSVVGERSNERSVVVTIQERFINWAEVVF